jgi:predicted O-methyltransferase YrrM
VLPRSLRRLLNEHYGSYEVEADNLHFAEKGRPLEMRDAAALYGLYRQGRSQACADYFHFIERCIKTFTLTHHAFGRDVVSADRHPDAKAPGWAGIGLIPIASYLYTLAKENVAGDLLECGVFYGGSTCCFSHVAADLNFKVIAADSFEGLPAASADGYYQKGDFRAGLEIVRKNVESYGVARQVVFHPGYFDVSLKDFPHALSSLFLDTDLYASSHAALGHVFARLNRDGVIFSDGVGMSRDFKDGKFAPESEEAAVIRDFFKEQHVPFSAAASGFDYLSIFAFGQDRPLVYSKEFMLATMLLVIAQDERSRKSPEHLTLALQNAVFAAMGPYTASILPANDHKASASPLQSEARRLAMKIPGLARLVRLARDRLPRG